MDKKIPVILDTDIGVDVDDIWALAMMLNCPQLDIKLVVTDTGDTLYAAKIVAKLLEIAGRTDIPVGIGIPLDTTPEPHGPWIEDYHLDKYPGKVIADGVGAIVDTIMQSDEQISLVCIGPLVNIAAALQREPKITSNSRFIGMHGSIYKGYPGTDQPSPEYNVFKYRKSAEKVFTTPWDITITPLDTCGMVYLKGAKFQKVCGSENALTKAVIENHHLWMEDLGAKLYKGVNGKIQSSLLFDTVAVYLAFSEELLAIETLKIKIDESGKTVIADDGQSIRCATHWHSLEKFEDFLVNCYM